MFITFHSYHLLKPSTMDLENNYYNDDNNTSTIY